MKSRWRKRIGWSLVWAGGILLAQFLCGLLGISIDIRITSDSMTLTNWGGGLQLVLHDSRGRLTEFQAFWTWEFSLVANDTLWRLKIGAGWLIVAGGLAWVAALCFLMRRRTYQPPLCWKCGYDRHGIAADQPCPECGKKPRLSSSP